MLVKSAGTMLMAGVSLLALTSNANALVQLPVIIGLWWFGKAIILTAAALKAAAIGTVFIVKGLAFTKAGAAVVSVAGTALAAEAAPATIEFLKKIDYHVEQQSLKMLHSEIETLAKNGSPYSTMFCTVDGKKVIVPNRYKVCPEDGSIPQRGEKFEYGG